MKRHPTGEAEVFSPNQTKHLPQNFKALLFYQKVVRQTFSQVRIKMSALTRVSDCVSTRPVAKHAQTCRPIPLPILGRNSRMSSRGRAVYGLGEDLLDYIEGESISWLSTGVSVLFETRSEGNLRMSSRAPTRTTVCFECGMSAGPKMRKWYGAADRPADGMQEGQQVSNNATLWIPGT